MVDGRSRTTKRVRMFQCLQQIHGYYEILASITLLMKAVQILAISSI